MTKPGATFVIAEAGVNHNGRLDLALRLVEIAVEAGADAVKFQTFHADQLVRAGAPKAEYQIRQTGSGDQLSMLRMLELSEADHRRVFDRCTELGIEFMSTPFDFQAADFLIKLGMQRIKVPSGEVTNKPFLEHLAAFGKPIIISTGMASLQEVQEALKWIAEIQEIRRVSAPITVLHCTSNYPAAPEDANLRAMVTLGKETGRAVGYSDHTSGIAIATAAVALGACVIEKHFTLDKKLPGPDHQASLEPHELVSMIRDIRSVEVAMGSGIKEPRASEIPVRDLVRRSVTLMRAVAAGEVLESHDLALLRPGTGISPRELPSVIGRHVIRNLPAGTTLIWSDLAP